MNNPIASAIKQICDEKGIPQEYVLDALELALAAAYRKDFGEKNQNIKVEFDLKTGSSRIFDVKNVVEDRTEEELLAEQEEAQAAEEVAGAVQTRTDSDNEALEDEGRKRFNPKTDIMLKDAVLIKSDAELGDEIKTELIAPEEYGRMAAQTAKQVIIQKLREAERGMVFQDFKDREGEVVIGTVQRREDHRVLVDLGKTTAIMPSSEQVVRERYNPGERIKVYVVSVGMGARGPEIIVSRSHSGMVKNVFFSEIPEVASGAIEIKGIAREAGQRAKVAVVSHQENIDPIGSCIGQRGGRIQTIISELGGEKIDVIQFDEDQEVYITNALSPAKIEKISLDEEKKTAEVVVDEDQLSLAIGRSGQNVRLASRLTGWNISVVLRDGSKTVSDEGETVASDESGVNEVVEDASEVETESSEVQE